MTSKDIGIAIGLIILMSINLIIQKIAVGQISIYVLGFLRVALVVPLIFVFPKPKKSLWIYALCGFFTFGLYLILLNLGLKEVGVNVTSFITQLQVFFTIFSFYFILREEPTWAQGFGILISFFGVYFLSATSSPIDFPWVDILYMVGACASFGIGTAYATKYKIGGVIEDMVWMALAASGPMLVACLLFEGLSETFNEILNITAPALFAACFGAIVITLLVAGVWLRLLQRSPSSSVMSFMLLVPIFSVIFSSFFLEETLTFHQFIAGLIILFGVMIAQNLHLRIPVLIYWVKNRMAL